MSQLDPTNGYERKKTKGHAEVVDTVKRADHNETKGVNACEPAPNQNDWRRDAAAAATHSAANEYLQSDEAGHECVP